MRAVTGIITAVAMGATCAIACADVIHVPADYPTIQQAIDAAVDGDEIVVAPGKYTESIDFLGKAIAIRGSESGATIVGTGGPVVTAIFDAPVEGVSLQSLSITGGTGRVIGDATYGGGLYLETAPMTLIDCVFETNSADYGGGVWTDAPITAIDCGFTLNNATEAGGGIASLDELEFDSCTIAFNAADVGGGVWSDGPVAVLGCSIFENVTEHAGGGIDAGVIEAGGHVELIDCYFGENISQATSCVWSAESVCATGSTFVHNEANAMVWTDGDLTVDACFFSQNGGVYGPKMLYAVNGSCTIEDCSFSGNEGDGVLAAFCATVVRGCDFSNNEGAIVIGVSGPAYPALIEDCTFTNSYEHSAVRANGTDHEVTIRSCEFTANTAGAIDASGGQFGYVDLTIEDCTFDTNSTPGHGGAVLVDGLSVRLDIRNSSFTNNQAGTRAGALHIDPYASAGTGHELYIADCSFTGNTAGAEGGAVYVQGFDLLTVERTSFMDNTGLVGGAVWTDVDLHLHDCTLDHNIATGGPGGAVYGEFKVDLDFRNTDFTENQTSDSGGAFFVDTTNLIVSLVDCDFSGNSAAGRGGAGAVHHHGGFGRTDIVNCAFASNQASDDGGALAIDSDAPDDAPPQTEIVNTVFHGNETAQRGGALFTIGEAGADSIALLANCTLANNTADTGAAVFHDNDGGTRVEIVNSIVWDNIGDPEIASKGGGDVTVSYSNVEGGFAGEGNIDASPQFLNATEGDFRLAPDSPCIDSGRNDDVPSDRFDLDEDADVDEPVPVDADGLPRFVDDPKVDDCRFAENCGEAPIVDIGAFERSAGIADLNGDGVVGPADLAIILGNWGPCADPDDCPADLDGDGVVGPVDLAIVLGNWG